MHSSDRDDVFQLIDEIWDPIEMIIERLFRAIFDNELVRVVVFFFDRLNGRSQSYLRWIAFNSKMRMKDRNKNLLTSLDHWNLHPLNHCLIDHPGQFPMLMRIWSMIGNHLTFFSRLSDDFVEPSYTNI